MRDLPYRLGLTLRMMMDAPGLFEMLHQLDWYSGMLQDWVDGLALTTADHVADIGCGPGLLVRTLAERGVLVTGIDRSPAMLRRAQRNLANLPNARIEQGSLPNLPGPSERFDVILAASVLNVVPDPLASLRGMVRLLRPGGIVSVLVPLPNHAQAGALADRWHLRGWSRAALRHWASLSRKMPEAQILGLYRLAGLEQVTLRRVLGGTVALVSGHRP